MKKIKRYFLKLLPYLVCIIAACIFYIIGRRCNSELKGLMHGIAGSFLSIPILFLIYELSKNYSQRTLNKELFDYAKMQIDTDVLSIINQLMKVSLNYNEIFMSPENIRIFLSQTEKDLINTIKTKKFLGFQVYKNWSITEKNITNVLENSFILKHLDSDYIIAVIELLKEVRLFESMSKNVHDLYISTEKKAEGYRIESGKDINIKNNEYPDRYLLLKHLDEDKYIVIDFGDFALYQREKLLTIYRFNEKYINFFSSSLIGLINRIKLWIELTGHEFIIDTKMFRTAMK